MAKLPKALQRTVDIGNAMLADAEAKGILKVGPSAEGAVVQLPNDPPPQQDPPDDPSPAQDPPTDPPPLAAKAADEGTWEQRYRTLQGKYNQETGALKTQLNASTARMTKLEQDVEEATRTIALLNARMTATPPPPAAPPRRLITEEEEQEYRPEFLDVVGRRAKEVLGDDVARIQQVVDDMKNQLLAVAGKVESVDKTMHANSAQEFEQQLDTAFPNWRAQNADPLFLDWLATTRDPLFGKPMQEALDDAVAMGDTPRVVRIFQGYPGANAAPSATPAPTPQPNNQGGRVRLETLAAPGRPRQPATREPQAPPVVTPEEISRFNNDVMKGRYRNRPQERAAMEARIEAAHRAGTLATAMRVPF